MSDSSDDIEMAAGSMLCTECDEHFEDCGCDDDSSWEIREYF